MTVTSEAGGGRRAGARGWRRRGRRRGGGCGGWGGRGGCAERVPGPPATQFINSLIN